MTADVANLVRQGRTAAAALARISDADHKRGRHMPHGSTINAQMRHRRTLDAVTAMLTELDRKDLAGAITAETDLLDRIAERKRLGTGHEDLTARLAVERAALRNVQ